MPKKSASFDIYKDAAGEWRWRIVAANHEIIGASTEGFSSLREARENAKRLGYALIAKIHEMEEADREQINDTEKPE